MIIKTTTLTFWATLLGTLVGLAVGVGGYTFYYAKGWSYLTNDPQACANCHVMQEHYDAWIKSSHRSVATCNDCHTPASFVGKYYTKAQNGFWHSYYFTKGNFHEPIQVKPANHKVTEAACRKCHQKIVDGIDAMHAPGKEMSCVRCHVNVGHALLK